MSWTLRFSLALALTCLSATPALAAYPKASSELKDIDGERHPASAGVYESNTLLLETALGWSGVLIEAGRDYIAGLRQQRRCRVSGRPGACCWMALDAEANNTRYWNTADQTSANPNAMTLNKWQGERDNTTIADRAVRTARLSDVLHHFGVSRVDYLSADCEGCEENALASLDLVHGTEVDVLTVEWPKCGLLKKFAAADYVVLPIRFTYDVVFVHARVAAVMPRPDLNGPKPSDESREKLRTELERCPEVKGSVFWGDDDAAVWPPPAPSGESPTTLEPSSEERLDQLERKVNMMLEHERKVDEILAAVTKQSP